MENILVVGANTRPIANSLNRMGLNVYSADYFGCEDLIPCVNGYNSILSPKPYQSNGFFSKDFSGDKLYQIAAEFIDIADNILCCSGADPKNFPKNKIIGNKDVKLVENKYKLYKTLNKLCEGSFKLPLTILVSDLDDAFEVADAYPDKEFLIKPLQGSGGIGIRKLNDVGLSINKNKVLLQEIVEGSDISTSVMSSGDEASTILSSCQLIGKKNLGQLEDYGYCGNLAPYNDLNLKSDIGHISEEIILDLGLVGSNGLDIIIKDEDIYIIEVNPRLQGTFEVAEASLDINMAETHINACNGNLKEITKPINFAMKMIVFAKIQSVVGDIKFKGVHDLPLKNSIIERGEPVATIVSSGKLMKDTIYKGKQLVDSVYSNLQGASGHVNMNKCPTN